MNKDLLNILSNSNKDIDNQKLMDYISGRLSDQDRHEVERWMVDNDFASEALEGLQEFSEKDKKELQSYVDQLNKDLNHYLQQKKQQRQKRKIREAPWVYVAILVILALAVLAYVVIRKLQQQ